MAAEISTADQQAGFEIGPPLWQRWLKSTWKFTTTYKLGAFGAFFVVLLIAMAAVPAIFANQDPIKQHLSDRLMGPSIGNWFGTDELGRDVYSRLVFGARTSIIIGFGTVVISKVISTAIGTISGYYGGWFDSLFQRIIDIGIAVPGLVFIILVVQTMSDRLGDTWALILAVGFLTATSSSRTIRGVALSLREEQYVEAARATGARDSRVMVRHMVPNLFPIILVSASLLVGSAILIESSLSFLGFGIQPPTPSWGRMLNDARENLTRAPHLAIFPGLVIFLTVYSFNMLGDALRDKLDPRLRGAN